MNAKQTNMIEGYEGPYLERSGISARAMTERLLAPPEAPLSDAEKQEAYNFESSLYQLEVAEGTPLADVIRGHKQESQTAPIVFAQPFLSGAIDSEFFPNGEKPSFASADDVFEWFSERAATGIDAGPAKLLKLAMESSSIYQKNMARSLADGTELAEEDVAYKSIVVDPVDLVEQSRQAMLAREHLLNMRRDLHGTETPEISGAKRAIVDVYLARVNSMIAANVPQLVMLGDQAGSIGDDETRHAAGLLIPKGFRTAIDDPGSLRRLVQRLDYLKNGIGLDDEGKASPISGGLRGSESAVSTEPTVYSPEQTRRLKEAELTPEQQHQIFSNILRKAGYLSEEDSSTWSIDRKYRAADGLFQVVENPSMATFRVEGVSGVFMTARGPRSVYDVMTVGGFHELAHINQSQADEEFGKTLKICGVKGKRVSMIREGGANMKQREAELKYFGVAKPVALTYAKALQTLMDGEDLRAASKAFFDEKLHAMPDMTPVQAAKNAADVVLRLIRGGGINSQPLAYAEEGILMSELHDADAAVKERAMAVTSLDLVDQVRLHRYGLLPELKDVSIDWSELVAEEMKPYIEKALQ